MPIVKFKKEGYKTKVDMMNLISYIAERADVVSGFGINTYTVESVYCSFEYVKRYWHKAEEGRRQVRHLIVIFDDSEMSLDTVSDLAWKIGALYGNRYQVFYGVHTDKEFPHIHYAINTVSYVDGLMFSEGYGDFMGLKNNIAVICAHAKR